jgi:Tfp pilus assembly protein PilN
MRAVNLIPQDARRGGGAGAAGRSGGMAYIVLGVLGVLVVMVTLWTTTGKSIKSKQADVAAVTQQATAAEARATALTSYATFATLRAKRVDTVKQLAATRFDWAHSMHELARVIPRNAWLSGVVGTTSPTAAVGGGGGAAGTLRQNLAVPALQITGCTTSQASVAKMMARMRLIDGVDRVSLQDSTASPDTGKKDASSNGTCGSSPNYPKFDMVVFYDSQQITGATASSAATTGAAGTTAPVGATTAGTTTPAGATATTATTSSSTPEIGVTK